MSIGNNTMANLQCFACHMDCAACHTDDLPYEHYDHPPAYPGIDEEDGEEARRTVTAEIGSMSDSADEVEKMGDNDSDVDETASS